jgi:hypothetical protein
LWVVLIWRGEKAKSQFKGKKAKGKIVESALRMNFCHRDKNGRILCGALLLMWNFHYSFLEGEKNEECKTGNQFGSCVCDGSR